ncbi:hypothetical protein HYALB_00003174 [Hymenoscyphus albidus]|uniref:Phosphotransferase n=1 Tax=Hymenoscyphus albidus TaxID=595503 RepID=A0A9N9LHL7_9HELO|nr:hypothetical protein HYALB_00003174 [Hymenoscyphus albidus]
MPVGVLTRITKGVEKVSCTQFGLGEANERKGFALAVDLGGTNLRVCSVELYRDTTYSAKHLKVAIPREIMVASHSAMLFSFIAAQVKTLLSTHHADKIAQASNQEPLTLGFTFSFPILQTGLNSGTLLRWTKGFNIPDAIGKDICHLLQIELTLLGLPVKVAALINDAVGTMMLRAYTLPPGSARTMIGTIFGTGTNGVYLEKISNITKRLEGDYDKTSGEMFVSTDWGSLNDTEVLPNTSFDVELDKFSVNPGFQIFEERVSGMFLGELLRLALVVLQASAPSECFSGWGAEGDPHYVSSLHKRWSIDSSILSIPESDSTLNLQVLRNVMSVSFDRHVTDITLKEARATKIIAHAIGKRAARLAGVATAAVILKSGGIPKKNPGNRGVDIAVDGSLIELYPGFEQYMREVFREIDGIGDAGEKEIQLAMTKHGSSIGAAITSLLCS